MSKEEKLYLIAIKTNDGKFYLSERDSQNLCNNENLKGCLFDGKIPLPTFRKEWVCVGFDPTTITKMVSQPDVNHRYELLDKTLTSDKLPKFIKREDIATYSNYDWIWNDDMSKYRSLYTLISDSQPDIEIEYRFEIDVVLEIPRVINPIDMKYKVPKNKWGSNGFTTITEKDIVYQLADEVLLPNLALPQRPCKLTSQNTYKIVRQYIKDNIDPKLATITSDYDFCFTVKRKIKKAEIRHYTVDVNNSIFQKRRRKPKLVKRQQSEEEKTCFEMTHAQSNYGNYTSIKGFEATTQKQLKKKIDSYCKGLVEFINTPMVECLNCKGDGVIVNKEKFIREEKLDN